MQWLRYCPCTGIWRRFIEGFLIEYWMYFVCVNISKMHFYAGKNSWFFNWNFLKDKPWIHIGFQWGGAEVCIFNNYDTLHEVYSYTCIIISQEVMYCNSIFPYFYEGTFKYAKVIFLKKVHNNPSDSELINV